MEEKEFEKDFNDEVKEKTETMVRNILNSDEIPYEKVKILGELIDIHKDMCMEKKYEEENIMRYSDYGDYGNYNDGSYGRRGVPGTGRGRYRNYRGADALDEMKYHYGNYMDSGNNYGAKDESSYKMIECFKDFGYQIAQDLEPKDKMMLKKAMQDVMQELD